MYKALVAKQPTLYETDKVSKEALAEWWDGERRFLLEPRSARGLPSNPSCDVIPRAEPIESRGLYG